MSDRLLQNGGMKYTIRYYPGNPAENQPLWQELAFCLLLAGVFALFLVMG
mgnify:CR=1 FL=1